MLGNFLHGNMNKQIAFLINNTTTRTTTIIALVPAAVDGLVQRVGAASELSSFSTRTREIKELPSSSFRMGSAEGNTLLDILSAWQRTGDRECNYITELQSISVHAQHIH